MPYERRRHTNHGRMGVDGCLVVPALFVAFQYLQEKFKPMEWEDVDNSDAEPEIEQYTK